MSLAIVLLYILTAYVLIGLCTAAIFVIFGATRLMDMPASMSAGARILIFPGAAVLWPYVLLRWLKAGRRS